MAEKNEAINYLGLEIRKPVVEYALDRRNRRNLSNCHFLECNVNVDLLKILKGIKKTSSPLRTVTILFPDPHFKEKHKKRRVVLPQLVEELAEYLEEEGIVYLASGR